MRELVTQRVVGRAERHLVSHEVDEEASCSDEENLHRRVVDRHKVEEQIAVADQEHE